MSEDNKEEKVKSKKLKGDEPIKSDNQKDPSTPLKEDKSEKKEEKKSEKKPEKILTPEEKCAEFEDKYKRALADYQNLLKRTVEEKQEFYKYANESFVSEIIPVYDNLRVSLDHVDDEAKSNGLAQGIKYVVKQFKDILEANGVKEIDALGKKFDPITMEAIEGDGKKVEKIVKPGYMIKDKVLVPAKVKLK